MNSVNFTECLQLLKVLYKRGLLTSPMYSISKDLLLSYDSTIIEAFQELSANGELHCSNAYSNTVVTEYHDRGLSHTFSSLIQSIESRAIDYIGVELCNVFDATYSVDDAHIDSNNAFLDHQTHDDDFKDRKNLVYGEVEYVPFTDCLIHACHNLTNSNKFVDLGSGCAKAICIASSICEIDEFVGIEVVHALHQTGIKVLKYYQEIVASKFIKIPKYHLIRGSFLKLNMYDWTDASLVFANSTCFNDELFLKIEKIAQQHMRIGSRIITFTSYFQSKCFKIIYKKRVFMSWGPCTVFIHEKITQLDSVHDEMCDNDNIDDGNGDSHFHHSKYIIGKQYVDDDIDDDIDNEIYSKDRDGSKYSDADDNYVNVNNSDSLERFMKGNEDNSFFENVDDDEDDDDDYDLLSDLNVNKNK